jgi:hypothetical protein
MKIVNLVLAIIIIISTPIAIISLANNLTTRMPDLYQYEFKSTEILGTLAIERSEDEMGQFFSEFMTGKTEKFQIVYQFGDNTDNLFTNNEQITMTKLKRTSDEILGVGIIALILFLISYFLLYKQSLKILLRKTFLKVVVHFSILITIITLCAFTSPLIDSAYRFIFNYEIESFMALPKLLPTSFFVHSLLTTVIISIIGMLILWYFTWKITKPRRIFGLSR